MLPHILKYLFFNSVKFDFFILIFFTLYCNVMKIMVFFLLQCILCILRAISYDMERNINFIGLLPLCHFRSDIDSNIILIFGYNGTIDSMHDHYKHWWTYVLVAYWIKCSFSCQFSRGMTTQEYIYIAYFLITNYKIKKKYKVKLDY